MYRLTLVALALPNLLAQRRWQKGFDGKETNIDEKQIDFVMGSGNHVRAFVHLTSRNTLQ